MVWLASWGLPMLFSWLKRRRRQRLLAEPFPAEWLAHLETNVAHYHLLTEAEQAKLRDRMRVFIAEKEWEGCRGLTMTDEIKVTVARAATVTLISSVIVRPRQPSHSFSAMKT